MSSTTKSVVPGKSAITISYSKPGTQPPIYLAGSFFNWQPQEMEHTVDEKEEYKFTKQVEVKEGQEYQYKFRVGDGDWWLLNEDEPTGTYKCAAPQIQQNVSSQFLQERLVYQVLVQVQLGLINSSNNSTFTANNSPTQ